MDHPLTPYAHRPEPSGRALARTDHDDALRVGEVERAAACDALAEHFAAGRLDPAELDDRIARAVGARTQGDLRVLFADLRPRRPVPDLPADRPRAERSSGPAVPALVTVVVLCLLLAGGMLLVLGAYNPALFVAALVGGVATAVAGGCLTEVGRAVTRRRQARGAS